MVGIRVKIVAARGIIAADKNGFSDPYVTMTLLNSRGNTMEEFGAFKTRIIKKTLNPEWNEEFILERDLRLATTIHLLLQDSDGVFGSDPIGVVDIPVDLITTNLTGSLANWYKITKADKMKKDATGELHVVFESLASPPPVPPPVPSSIDTNVSVAVHPPNLLYVEIKSGKGLLAMDDGKTSDPLVKMVINGKKHETTRKEKTLNPQWNEKVREKK